MMARFPNLLRNQRGASLMEFGLIAPVLMSIIIGASQLGILFFANAGLQHAIGEGARVAMVFPRPSVATIQAAIRDSRYGLDPAKMVGDPVVTVVDVPCVDDDAYAEISWRYDVPLNFIFFQTRAIRLQHSRRAFLQPVAAAAGCGGGGGGGGGGGHGWLDVVVVVVAVVFFLFVG